MFRALATFLRRFFLDEEAFLSMSSKLVAQLRATIGGIGVAGLGFADPIVNYLQNPQWVDRVRGVSVALVMLAFFLRAGDRTPPEVKALAAKDAPP